ncbi:MAG: DNA-3-methyladenine glycosylase I [Pirellulaceae bacterium]|nr:DNA-3-methyladenine glycosylase I [Pirellulaceae bacterium]
MAENEEKPKYRCQWASGDLDVLYHDQEWGVPVHEDRKLFEFLTLEGAQAGLSWTTVLKKRENYRRLFDNFEIAKVARYSEKKIEQLLTDRGIIRNRLKVTSTVDNAKAVLKIQKEFGTLDEYIWRFVGGQTIVNRWKSMEEIPASTPLANEMSKALKKRGFRFVGPTICYAFMQAIGMVNDHEVGCFRYTEV